MLPLVTACPPNRLTPSRCPCESRPFVDEPPPFLCAMRTPGKFALRDLRQTCCAINVALWKLNFADFDRRVVLAVASLNFVLSAGLELQDLELRTAAMSHDFSGDLCLTGIGTTRK